MTGSEYYWRDVKPRDEVITSDFEKMYGELKKHRIVCPYCEGEGVRTNPAIQGPGPEDDPYEFRQELLSGAYDVVCEECQGLRVCWAVSPENDQHMLDRWQDWMREAYESADEQLQELRSGA